jgi:hypothetical protein
MAAGKKSFVLYCDLIHTVEQLPNDKAGELFKHILAYVNDLNPISNDLVLNISFEPIKQQLKRDLNKWEKEIKPKRTESGRLGGLKSGEARRSKTKQNEANASNSKQNEANEAVNVNVSVNDNVLTKVNNRFGDEFTSYVSQWLDYKKDRKEGYKSERSIIIFCEKLSKMSNGQLSITKEIIETSMANNWAGIFELKKGQTQNSQIEETDREYKVRMLRERGFHV